MKHRIVGTILLTLLAFAVPVLEAESAPSFQGLLRWPTTVVNGLSTAALPGNPLLVVLNLKEMRLSPTSAPATTLSTTTLPITDSVRAAAFDGDRHLYIACETDGILVYNIEDPAEPKWVSTYNPNPVEAGAMKTFCPLDLAFHDNRLFVADFLFGLRVFSPEADGSLPDAAELEFEQKGASASGGYTALHVQDHLATTYISVIDKYFGVRVFAFPAPPATEPDWHPQRELQFTYKGNPPYYVAKLVGICGKGQYIYASDEDKGITALDLSGDTGETYTHADYTALEIDFVGRLTTPGRATDIVAHHNRLYVADSDQGLTVIDISVPEDLEDPESAEDPNPFIKTGLPRNLADPNRYQGAHSMALLPSENRLFLANYENGISDIALAPPPTATGHIPGTFSFNDIEGSETTLFVTDRGHDKGGGKHSRAVSILAIESFTQPVAGVDPYFVEENRIPIQTEAARIALKDTTLCIAESSHGFSLYDVTERAVPVQIASRSTPNANDALFFNDHLLILTPASLESWTVSASPVRTGSIPVSGGVSLSASEDRIWVATGNGNAIPGFSMDASGNLTQESSFPPTSGFPLDSQHVREQDGHIFVANGSHGFLVIRLSDGTASRLAIKSLHDETQNVEGVFHLILFEHYAILSCGKDGLRSISITDPLVPTASKSVESYGDARAALYESGLLFSADGGGGLTLYQFTETTPVTDPAPMKGLSGGGCFIDVLL